MAAPKHKSPKELAPILAALLTEKDDRRLLEALEALAKERAFSSLTPIFGPALYRRDRVRFRPFILAHFAAFSIEDWRWAPIPWSKHAAALDPWLAEVDAQDDVELFRRLWPWKNRQKNDQFLKELTRRYAAAPTPEARQLVLEKMTLGYSLDEASALELYRIEKATSTFILAHTRRIWGAFGAKKSQRWTKLAALANQRGDHGFELALYRRQVDEAEWASDVKRLVSDPLLRGDALVEALKERHPELARTIGPTILGLIEARGREVLPYVFGHLASLGYGLTDRSTMTKLLDRSLREGWLDLWGGILRVAATPKEYDAAVKALLHDQRSSDEQITEKLRVLAGVAREWNIPALGVAQVRPLEDETAVIFFERFPELLERHYKSGLTAGWWVAYPRLVSKLIEAGEETLLDYLASRLVTRPIARAPKETQETIELLSAYYEGLRRDVAQFHARATLVLGRVPPYSIHAYDETIRTNRLARLLFERSVEDYLADATSIRDLLEAPEIHVQLLAFRALARPDPRAAILAAENLDLLLPTLLRSLHRKTRNQALRALAQAAISPEHARQIVDKAKAAMALPDRRYPKEALVTLIAQVLHRWPDARGPGETPVVRRSA